MAKRKILIADDSKSMQMFYDDQLSNELFEKRLVDNGQEAIAVYETWKPDLILLDFNMPVLDGFNTLKKLRQELNDQSTPVIMVTSRSEKDKVLACAQIGIKGYIVKPFKAEELLKKISFSI